MRDDLEEILIKCGIEKKDLNCEDFVKAELMDSLTVADVVVAIEDKYNIEINGEDILPECFINIETIECLVKKYISSFN